MRGPAYSVSNQALLFTTIFRRLAEPRAGYTGRRHVVYICKWRRSLLHTPSTIYAAAVEITNKGRSPSPAAATLSGASISCNVANVNSVHAALQLLPTKC